jgi:sulfopyruvate decarboxylase TPP-binding subunit
MKKQIIIDLIADCPNNALKILELIENGKRIEALKEIRKSTGYGLKEGAERMRCLTNESLLQEYHSLHVEYPEWFL